MKQLIIFLAIIFLGLNLNAQADSTGTLKFYVDTSDNTLKIYNKQIYIVDTIFLNAYYDADTLALPDTIIRTAPAFTDLLWESEGVKLSCENYKILSICASDSMNCVNLKEAYDEAKVSTPNGDALSATNRYTLIAPAGYYNCADTFRVDSQFVDIVSLTGNRDIILSGATIKVTANDVFLKGIDVGTGANIFLIDGNLNNLKVENCRGGNGSFGGTSITVSGNFKDCVGGNGSFGAVGGIASGTFINCIAGQQSFGTTSSGTFINCTGGMFSFGFGASGTASGTFTNCVGGGFCFGSTGGTLSGTFNNCIGGTSSFNGTITGKLQYCRINGTGSFPTPSGGGVNNHYVNGDGSTDNSAGSAQDLSYAAATGIMSITGGTGDTISVATATVRGLVPDPPNNANFYLAGDGTFDEFREKIIVLDSSYNTNSTTHVNIGKLTVNLDIGKYLLTFEHVHYTTGPTEGCGFGFTVGTATLGDQAYIRNIANGTNSTQTAYNTTGVFTSSSNGSNLLISGEVKAFIDVTAAGTMIPTFRTETGNINSCTIKEGLSFIKILKL